MRGRTLSAAIVVLGSLTACNHSDEHQSFQLLTGPSSSASRPALDGTVLVAGIGPLADATVTLVSSRHIQLNWLRTNSAGVFHIPATSEGCDGPAILQVEKTGYMTRQVAAPDCVSASNPQPVAVTLRVQEELEASIGSPVHTTLSNDDLDWGADSGTAPLCAPCKLVFLPEPKSEPLQVTIEWSTPDRLSFWLTASDQNYDGVTLGAWQAAPGTQTHSIIIQPSNGANFYYTVLVGLPAGSSPRGGLTGVADLRVSVKSGG